LGAFGLSHCLDFNVDLVLKAPGAGWTGQLKHLWRQKADDLDLTAAMRTGRYAPVHIRWQVLAQFQVELAEIAHLSSFTAALRAEPYSTRPENTCKLRMPFLAVPLRW
jgi:hypothetical protein